MKILSLFFWLALVWVGQVQGQGLFSRKAGFEVIPKAHEEIGILPFMTKLTLRPEQMEALSTEQLKQMERLEGESIQHAVYTWFEQRVGKSKLKVRIQEPGISNALLEAAGITHENYEQCSPAHLARILGVDAVIMGNYETNHPMAEITDTFFSPILGELEGTHLSVINLAVYNAEDGNLLLQYHNSMAGIEANFNEGLVNALMRKVSRKMAYTII